MGKQLRLAFEDEVFSPIIKEELGNFVSAMTNSLANLGNSVSGLFGGSSSLFGEGGAGLSSFFTSDNIYNAIKDIDIGGALDAAFENSGIGSTIGGIVGSIFGPIGSAAGSALGSIIESAFGGSTQ